MAQGSSFNLLYLAGMAALALLATLTGVTLTGERHSGVVGSIEIPVLLVGAALFVAAGVGAGSSPGASWPLLAAVAGVILVGVLAFLTLTLANPGSALIFEIAGVVLGIILAVAIRND